ncbi:MAG TPA: polysaccharide biosynthesis/export family protein [Chitinophagaceae bacterium]
MKILRFVFFLALPVYLMSCGASRKAQPPYYLERATDTSKKGEVKVVELKIQKNDLLSIQVYSASTKPEADLLYNLPLSGSGGASAGGFLVDSRGNIEYPRLGTIHAEGLTKQQLADIVKEKLTRPIELLSNPTVIVRFVNIKITVLGQVGNEGVITVPGEKLTILEAVGLAGGVTDLGKKERVKIIRETDGYREIGYIDLSSDSLFNSPYYQMVQNDVLIVEPNRKKLRSEEQQATFQKISFAITLITVAATLYSIFK